MGVLIISLNKQVQIYSVDTSFFYNDDEMKIHKKLNKAYYYRKKAKLLKKKNVDIDYAVKLTKHLSYITKRINDLKNRLRNEFAAHSGIRNLRASLLSKKHYISVFDSVLTRTLGIKQNTLSEDIIVIQTYFFEVLKDIILDGFMFNGEKYICFTASAGQIRTKKTVFIKESVYQKYQDSLTCGLSIDSINAQGGVNINKYLAYLALCNSATDEWKDFDITKAIVVEDMETTIRCLVDHIDDKTYEITRKEMDVTINHTDGCGMILPRKNKKSMMVRLPWIKGLLIPFPFDKFIREANRQSNRKYGIVTDIYGKQHDLLKDGIEVIFTKSQFKMWKYYKDWQEYICKYLKFNCQAGKCNEEEALYSNAKINYQMLQTLSDITDDELEALSHKTKQNIINIGSDKTTMLKVLGVIDANRNKNYVQQALEIYPELLSDTYSREILKNVKRSMVKDARAGKIDIEGKYTFICPDLYAFCQWLILGEQQPTGLLNNGTVSCKLYKDAPKLDCLRSPHLYLEHAVRENVITKEISRWFVTDGLYTSIHDPISKILMFDVDGDKALVCADPLLIEIAERNMRNIVPLYYEMKVSGKNNITNGDIYNGLKAAYTGGNIGAISNDITKIWNSEDINLNVIKWLCMENNFTIDYAKTLYKVKRPKEIGKIITRYTKNKVPHFFMYAKDKKNSEVEKLNRSTVNRLSVIIPNPRFSFKSTGIGKFNYKMLMQNPNVSINQTIVEKYNELDAKSRFMLSEKKSWSDDIKYNYVEIREKILSLNDDISYVVDVLVEYLYGSKKSDYKVTLWECFGDVIVGNLRSNVNKIIGDKIQCEICGERIEFYNTKKYCDECAKEKERQRKRLWKKNSKMVAKMKTLVTLDT